MSRIETYTNSRGKFSVRGIVCFVVFTPTNYPIFTTCRRKMKDACMAFEDATDRDWDELANEGFRVMKLFSGGYDRTDQSLISIDQWVVDTGGAEVEDPETEEQAA